MDAMRIFWGTPLLVYFDIEDPSVTPKEHITRALGGPMFNAVALIPVTIGRGLVRSSIPGPRTSGCRLGLKPFSLIGWSIAAPRDRWRADPEMVSG